ncbi:hypothetical protein ABT294_27515 [Nonomuraea sp. NPDC000554]|uniref:hypothetical protein n=1 Tax=Nonomuraea sp. NPDC000554 TaxID=3154259 RepID=UPI00332BBB6F
MPVRVVIPLAAVAAVLLGAGVWLLTRGDTPRPAAFRAEPTSALYTLIDSRQRDAAPLTPAEVFTPATERLGALKRGQTEQFADCGEALAGVDAPGCTQALRAAYTGDGVAGQFVIFNLSDGRAADALVAALGKDGFVGQAVTFDASRSRAEARAMGHYVTVSWAGATRSGAAPDLVPTLIALDGLGRVVQGRVIAAT